MTQKKKKIAVVIPKYGLVGGAEGYAAELTERLALNPAYDIHVFANRWIVRSDHVTFHRVPIIPFPKFMTTVSFAYFVEEKTLKIPFDLIHSHDRIFEADLFTLHGIPHRLWVQRVRKKSPSLFDLATAWVEKKLVYSERCVRFFPVSRLTRSLFLEAYPMDPARVEVISPGIHMADYQKLDRKICRQQIRTPLGIDSTDVLILFVSMNFEIKGLDRLIQAVGKLGQNVKLLIVGKGNEQKYRHLAGQLGIADRVLFAGVVSREKLLPIYMAADIYAMLSAFDTFGMVVLEAMAASLPVIISTHVGARDLVNEGENGFIIEGPGGIEEIADRIARMLNNDLRQRMGRAAFQTALHNTWDDVAQKVDAHYRSLLKIN